MNEQNEQKVEARYIKIPYGKTVEIVDGVEYEISLEDAQSMGLTQEAIDEGAFDGRE